MFNRKILVSLVMAGLSGAAFAQQAGTGKVDIFGRPSVDQTAAQVYYQADPFDPVPQNEQLRRAEREAAGTSSQAAVADKKDVLGRAQLNETANEVYFSADPFDPLPGLQPLYRASIAAHSASAQANPAGTRKDVFGRADSGFDGLQAYHEISPFEPLPQFWNHDVEGVGAVAGNPGDTKVVTKKTGGNG